MDKKYIILKELSLDACEELVEFIASSKMMIHHKLEDACAKDVLEAIIWIDTDKINFSMRISKDYTLLEFSDNENLDTIEINNKEFIELVIR